MQAQESKQNAFIRKAQSSRDGSIYVNLPSEWIALADVKKSDALNLSVIQNENEFYLLVSKLQESL